ncbi:hypothetical protein [Novosphingobium aquimarinum]|nr:hypothetical protein [Novosphingobium aquimarinum]
MADETGAAGVCRLAGRQADTTIRAPFPNIRGNGLCAIDPAPD